RWNTESPAPRRAALRRRSGRAPAAPRADPRGHRRERRPLTPRDARSVGGRGARRHRHRLRHRTGRRDPDDCAADRAAPRARAALGWRRRFLLGGDLSNIADPLALSLEAALSATVIVTVLGVVVGFILAKGRFPGRDTIESLLCLPMALPPTVVGYYLLTTYA